MKLVLLFILCLNSVQGCNYEKEKEKACVMSKMKKSQQFDLVPSAVMLAF